MKWEHISGGVGEQNQVTIRDLVQVEERLATKEDCAVPEGRG